jgi:glycosyltransferase involved in cell wall biosynthesis
MLSRILVIGQLPPPVHGSNVMTERFMNALGECGYEACIVEKTFSKSMDEVGKASYRKVLMVPDLCRRVVAAVNTFRPDLCVYFISVGLQSLLVDCLVLRLLERRNIPYLLYFHGRGYRTYEAARFLAVRGIIHKALQNAAGGLVLGEALKEDVNHLIADERLLILPNGIPEPEQPPPPRKTTGSPLVVFLSNLIPAKGPLRFLQMAKLVHAEEPGVRFVMAGRHTTEAYLRELKTFIQREGLATCVELPGPVYGMDKAGLFNTMDVLVFPTSFDKETFGIVNIEAMQYGVPVISSPVGAIPEIIQDGLNGYIVAPDDIRLLADRVLALIRNPALRQQMGDAGCRRFYQHYSLEAYTRNVQTSLDVFLKNVGAGGAEAVSVPEVVAA